MTQKTTRDIMGAIPCAAGLLAVLLFTGCDKSKKAQSASAAAEVDVARPVVRENVEWDEYTGRLAAVETVEVRSRVDGYIEKIHFKAGQIVNKGDLLFTIDPRPFQADLDRARAAVQNARAGLEHADYDLRRVESLKTENSAPEKEYRDTLFEQKKAQAELERTSSEERFAALNLEWSHVVAPITGRISRELVTVGNLVHDGSTAATLLTTIVSLDPVHCYFDVDEQAYLKYARMSQSGERASSREHANPVHVALFDEQEYAHHGQMDFVDNAIDPLTGTLRGRAVLPNPDHLLLPGLFVRVRLIGSGVKPMVFLPDAAIAADQTTRFVYTIDDKNTVSRRSVTLGRLQSGLRRILSGLDGSETIVVKGVQRVRPKAIVQPHLVAIPTGSWLADASTASQPASQPAMIASQGELP